MTLDMRFKRPISPSSSTVLCLVSRYSRAKMESASFFAKPSMSIIQFWGYSILSAKQKPYSKQRTLTWPTFTCTLFLINYKSTYYNLYESLITISLFFLALFSRGRSFIHIMSNPWETPCFNVIQTEKKFWVAWWFLPQFFCLVLVK